MLRCGLVYQGLMVNMRVSNDKLAARAQGMVQTLAGVDEQAAKLALSTSQDHIKKAVLLAAGVDFSRVDDLLETNAQSLRAALEQHALERS